MSLLLFLHTHTVCRSQQDNIAAAEGDESLDNIVSYEDVEARDIVAIEYVAYLEHIRDEATIDMVKNDQDAVDTQEPRLEATDTDGIDKFNGVSVRSLQYISWNLHV
jgi:hypothetical protein